MATRYLGLKVELDPTTAQRALLASHAGTRRFVYNWALETANAPERAPKAHHWPLRADPVRGVSGQPESTGWAE